MKKLFEVFLYLNVAVGSLFFVVWLWTTFPAFLSVPAEGSPAIGSPPPSSENTSSPHPPSSPPPPIKEANPGSGSPSGSASPLPTNKSRTGNNLAIPRKGASISNPAPPPPSGTPKNNLAIPRKGASISNPAPPPPSGTPKKDNSIPLPPDPSSAGLENSQLPPSPQGKENSIPHPPDPSSAGLENSQLPPSPQGKENFLEESETSSNKAIKSGTAKDLQGITQKIADIYEMLSNYQYDSEDRRDPFAPFFQVEEQPIVKGVVVEEDTPPTYPTGKYPIEEIKLVGIKWNSKIGPSKALFKTPDQQLHQLQKNDRIGDKRAVIYQLKEDEVVILEPRRGRGNLISKKEKSYTPIILRMARGLSKDKNQSLGKYTSSSSSSSSSSPSLPSSSPTLLPSNPNTVPPPGP